MIYKKSFSSRFFLLGNLIFLAWPFIGMSSAQAGFQRGVTVVSDDATQHKAFVDCDNVTIRRTIVTQTANWKWRLAIYDGDRDGLKNDVVFIGSASRHRIGSHPPEAANRLITLDLDAICNNAADQAARVPQHSQRDTIHAPLGHQDFVQIRADAAPAGAAGVRISIQLNHLYQQSPIPLDAPLVEPTINPDEGESGSEQGGVDDSQSGDDCNGNGLADEVDIAIGIDGDANNDGIPNACQISGKPSVLSILWGALISFLLVVIIVIVARRRSLE